MSLLLFLWGSGLTNSAGRPSGATSSGVAQAPQTRPIRAMPYLAVLRAQMVLELSPEPFPGLSQLSYSPLSTSHHQTIPKIIPLTSLPSVTVALSKTLSSL